MAKPKIGIYERAIYVIAYKATELLQKIQTAHQEINLAGLGIMGGGERDLNTKALSKYERMNRDLDVITGFELIDSQKRMFVFEGLSCGSMRALKELLT